MSVYVDTATAQFENVNALRKYPFADDSFLFDSSGRELPSKLISDLHMVIPADIEGRRTPFRGGPVARLSNVHISQSMISACLKVEFDGKTSALSVTVSAKDFKPYFPYRLEKLAGSGDVGGIISFGDVEFPGFPETYRMLDPSINEKSGMIHPVCVAVVKPAGLRRIIDRRSGESVHGDVNMSFSGYVKSYRDGKSFSLVLEDGAETELASDCFDMMEGDNACGATPIRSINGVYPDEDGNIVLWFH